MDVFAHGLWTNVMYRVLPQTKTDRKTIWWGIAFGVLPDFASFAPIFVLSFYRLITGEIKWSADRPDLGTFPLADLTQHLYDYTHSLVIWAVAVLLVWGVWRKFPWLLLGWGLHVAIDIFSHSKEFFPTPFLFPISDTAVNGVPWSHPVFMLVNYGLLLLLYAVIWPLVVKRKKALQ